MNSRKIAVLVLAVFAISWRFFTWASFDKIGFVGIRYNDLGVITKVSSASPAEDAGLLVGDKILSLKSKDLNERPRPYQRIEYTIERNSTQMVISLTASEYKTTKILGVMGIIILIIGLMVFYQKRHILSFVFFLYCFVMTIHWGSYPRVASLPSEEVISLVYVLLSIFLGSVTLHFGFIYPKSKALSLRAYSIIYLPGAIGLTLFIATFFNRDLIFTFKVVEPILVAVFALAGGVVLFRTYFITAEEKRSDIGINIICLGILLANLPYIFSTFLPFMDFGEHYGAILYRLLFIIQPISFAIGIRRLNRFQQVD